MKKVDEALLDKLPKPKNGKKQVTTEQLKSTYTKEEIEQMMRDVVEVEKYVPGSNLSNNGKLPPSVVDDGDDKKAPMRSHVLSQIMKWYKLPRVQSEDELQERLELFFETCVETGEYPTVEKMSLSIGITTQEIGRYRRGERLSSERFIWLLDRAYETIHAVEAQMASERATDATVYIFRSKNYFGMTNEVNVNYVSDDRLGRAKSDKELEELYAETIIDVEFEEKE